MIAFRLGLAIQDPTAARTEGNDEEILAETDLQHLFFRFHALEISVGYAQGEDRQREKGRNARLRGGLFPPMRSVNQAQKIGMNSHFNWNSIPGLAIEEKDIFGLTSSTL